MKKQRKKHKNQKQPSDSSCSPGCSSMDCMGLQQIPSSPPPSYEHSLQEVSSGAYLPRKHTDNNIIWNSFVLPRFRDVTRGPWLQNREWSRLQDTRVGLIISFSPNVWLFSFKHALTTYFPVFDHDIAVSEYIILVLYNVYNFYFNILIIKLNFI